MTLRKYDTDAAIDDAIPTFVRFRGQIIDKVDGNRIVMQVEIPGHPDLVRAEALVSTSRFKKISVFDIIAGSASAVRESEKVRLQPQAFAVRNERGIQVA